MGYRPDQIFLSLGIIYALVSLFYLLLLKIIHIYTNTPAVFSRSMQLITLSLSFSYTQILISILYGALLLQDLSEFDPIMIITVLSLLLCNEFFFMTILLKVYRIINLVKLNNGLFNTENSSKIRTRLDNFWNLKVILAYGFGSLAPRIVTIIVYESDSRTFEICEMILNLTVIVQIVFECVILLAFIVYIIRSNCDVSLRIEYCLYLIAWGGSYMVYGRDEGVVFLLILPIRNILMEMLNVISIYEHDKHYVLPLPDVVDLDFILRSEFFVTRFREHFMRIRNKRAEIEFEILLSICVYRETSSEEERKKVETKLKAYQKLTDGPVGFVNLGMGFDPCQVYSEVYVEFDNSFLQAFLKSNEFKDMKIDYICK